MDHQKADELEERLIELAVQVIFIAERLPATRPGVHIAGQVLRSGTAPAPHYGEARGAESRADFLHKLRIAVKELNETNIWLKIASRARLVQRESVAMVMDECRQLGRILSASIRTARDNEE